jgi:predicted CXXCH cytochrome family protein
MFEGEHVHGPVQDGDCSACHSPHASPHANQLRADPGQICFECHVERTDIMENRHSHPPVQEDCAQCHEVHASANNSLLDMPAPELCFSCHDTLATYVDSSNPHPPFNDGSCDVCHNPHGSENAALLHEPAAQVCFECHDEFEEFLTSSTFRHGPTQQDDCNACHSPHGSNNHRMLRKYFPEKFYVAYEEDNYAICFECHNGQIAQEEQTETLTDFRDGTRNLHYVHVNKQEKGRSCRACHQVHASSQEKHIRLTVPYGKLNWELPVNFTMTNNGGSCQVGCHNPKEYSRE